MVARKAASCRGADSEQKTAFRLEDIVETGGLERNVRAAGATVEHIDKLLDPKDVGAKTFQIVRVGAADDALGLQKQWHDGFGGRAHELGELRRLNMRGKGFDDQPDAPLETLKQAGIIGFTRERSAFVRICY